VERLVPLLKAQDAVVIFSSGGSDGIRGKLPDALKLADGVFISQVARLDQIPPEQRLNPEAVVDAIAASGRPAFYEPDAAHIIERLVPLLKTEDVVIVFSNGGFEGIHEKLLERLKS
jgi:UDP-N-acetylmuramate: L-alanyl-gamma-D-glutamyl-meso-diaminopimelate ligase